MLDYLKAEFYKVLHRKYTYGFLAAMMGCAALLLAGWAYTNSRGSFVDFGIGGGMAVMVLIMGLYMSVVIEDIVYSEQYKHNTLKNEVSFGVPRTRIYLGKLVVAIVVGVLSALLVLAFYEVVCLLILPHGAPGLVGQTLDKVLYCTLTVLPQWLALLAVCNMLFFLVRSSTVASFLCVGIIVLPQTAFHLLALFTELKFFNTLADWMPNAIADAAQNHVGDWSFVAQSWTLGLAWIAVTTAIGLFCFRKKEIS